MVTVHAREITALPVKLRSGVYGIRRGRYGGRSPRRGGSGKRRRRLERGGDFPLLPHLETFPVLGYSACMTPDQEEALYVFLEDAAAPFTVKGAADFVRRHDAEGVEYLADDIEAFLSSSPAAFRMDARRWISRRGFFEGIPFVISPSKLELLNGILIPGHRCLPFANPAKMPQEYEFFYRGRPVPGTTSEGAPDDFYPYYGIFGKEYAPQIVARDNPKNESAFLQCEPYDDPAEVSIHTLDMRHIFREGGFVPGDRLVVRTVDWKEARFSLEKVGREEWSKAALGEWATAADRGFHESFTKVGPGVSTEEQLAFAYWYGGERMLELPAYSLEEFLYEVTEGIEDVEYGIESRFWFAGREIPDSKGLIGASVPPDRTPIEDILFEVNVPVSEYVIQAYVRDAMFRNEKEIGKIILRIVPQAVKVGNVELRILAKFIVTVMEDLGETYNAFLDRPMGELRRHIGELHHAVIELAAQIRRWNMDASWLPKHTFIMLSQIQEHAAELMMDLNVDEPPPKGELDAIDESLESMVETFTDIKEMLRDSTDNFRRSNMQLVYADRNCAPEEMWQTVQISLGGTDVWRRVIVPGSWKLEDLHTLILVCLEWKGALQYHFYAAINDKDRRLVASKIKIREVRNQGISKLEYEYGARWTVRVTFVSSYQPDGNETIRCVAGEGSAPPEQVTGPLRFRKMLSAIAAGNDLERQTALSELGQDFSAGFFDREKCNRDLQAAFASRRKL